jgi:hypothetical protein
MFINKIQIIWEKKKKAEKYSEPGKRGHESRMMKGKNREQANGQQKKEGR